MVPEEKEPSPLWWATWQQACGHDTGQQLRVHIPVHNQGAMTGKLAMTGPFEASKPTPNDTLPSTKAHFHIFLKQFYWLWITCSNTWVYDGHSHSTHSKGLQELGAGNELEYIRRAPSALNCWVISPGPCIDCFYIKGALDLIKCLSWVHQEGKWTLSFFLLLWYMQAEDSSKLSSSSTIAKENIDSTFWG